MRKIISASYILLPMNKALLLGVNLFFYSTCCFAKIEHHYREWEHQTIGSAVKNIDFVYLINLDTRPEKLKRSLEQLAPFGIVPERFPAIYGWDIPTAVMNDIGLRLSPQMWIKEHVLIFPKEYRGLCSIVAPSEEWRNGGAVFSSWMTPGAIGCSMSHLSVVNDAYECGYETVWALEDDLFVDQNPHRLSALIEELDSLVGKGKWDILYTDHDYLQKLDNIRGLQDQFPMKWRPDMPSFDLRPLLEYTPIGDHFFKIGSRNRTHSMIIRRSGMEKILHFYREHQIFLPIDHELAFIPGLQLYILKENIVSSNEMCSDIKFKHFYLEL
jgi:GR25 family glycosyltransferase involved in LPS biosynthesis